MDVAREDMAIPFDINDGIIKVCFANTSNTSQIEAVRLLMLNRGLVMERYITFRDQLEKVLEELNEVSTETIDTDANGTSIVDNIIRTGMSKRGYLI